MNDNNNTSDSTTNPNVISFKDFQKDKKVKTWPSSKVGEPVPVATEQPATRRLLINLTNGDDLLIDGYMGLHNSFLVIGDGEGNIKFAAAAGEWKFAADVTNHPEYMDHGEEDQQPS